MKGELPENIDVPSLERSRESKGARHGIVRKLLYRMIRWAALSRAYSAHSGIRMLEDM
jgi:hypothetical protein